METSQQQKFYKAFREAVKKRTVNNMAVPVSGGLDSTLIVKALYDNGDIDKCKFVFMDRECPTNIDLVTDTYGIKVHKFSPIVKKGDWIKVVQILEEPFYAHSVNYYLYKEIHYMNCRVSMSGLGADELFGGYDYYGTSIYPRGLFEEIKAESNEEKKKYDIDFLIHHHLRENEKIGLYWNVEGRYPFLDKEVSRFKDVGKSLIKSTLLKDFPSSFVYRKKEGFRIDDNKDREHQRKEYIKQLKIWKRIFV